MSTSTGRVTVGLTVARSAATCEVLREDDQLSLEQYAALAEFEVDAEAHADLLDTLRRRPVSFDFNAARWRRIFARREACEAVAGELRAEGLVVVVADQLPDDAEWLDELCTGHGTVLTVENHVDCPGHALFLDTDAYYQSTVEPVPICTSWVEHGHAPRRRRSAPAADGPTAEEVKAERRRVIRNNKAWIAAQDVRRAGLKVLLAKKTPPKQADHFIAATLMAGGDEAQRSLSRQHPLVCELLDCGEATPGAIHPCWPNCAGPPPPAPR